MPAKTLFGIIYAEDLTFLQDRPGAVKIYAEASLRILPCNTPKEQALAAGVMFLPSAAFSFTPQFFIAITTAETE